MKEEYRKLSDEELLQVSGGSAKEACSKAKTKEQCENYCSYFPDYRGSDLSCSWKKKKLFFGLIESKEYECV